MRYSHQKASRKKILNVMYFRQIILFVIPEKEDRYIRENGQGHWQIFGEKLRKMNCIIL